MEDMQTSEQETQNLDDLVPAQTETEETETPTDVEQEETPSETEAETSPEQPAPEQESEPEPQPEADPYKEKFRESTREAMLLAERNKVANARLEQITKQDTPTDEAMRQLHPEWDELNEVTKRTLIRIETEAMARQRMELQQQDILDRAKQDEEIEAIIDDPKFEKLQGKEAEFKRFARSPKNRGIPAEALAKAFLFDVDEPSPHTPVKKPGLERGSGPQAPAKPQGMTPEQEYDLMQKDPARYAELIAKGVIK